MTVRIYPPNANIIIGGDFHTNPWQRGTSFISPASGDYLADRFRYRDVGTQLYTITRDPDAPPPTQTSLAFIQSMRTVVTTANAAPAAADFSVIEQPVEGYIAVQTYEFFVFMDFWVNVTVPGIYCMSFQNNTRTRSLVTEYTINLANTWENIVFQIPVDSLTGTWENTNLTGIHVIWTLNAGTNFQTAPDVWTGGNFLATSNQTNTAGSLANEFKLALTYAGVRNSSGNWPSLSRQEVLLPAQRYYEKSYNIDVAPGTITDVGQSSARMASDSELRSLQTNYRVTKRATPSITWYSTDTGASGNVFRANATEDRAVISTSGAGQCSTGWPTIGSSVGTDWDAQWTADAEL